MHISMSIHHRARKFNWFRLFLSNNFSLLDFTIFAGVFVYTALVQNRNVLTQLTQLPNFWHHMWFGPASAWEKSVHFGSMVKKHFWIKFTVAKINIFLFKSTFTKAIFLKITLFISKIRLGPDSFPAKQGRSIRSEAPS